MDPGRVGKALEQLRNGIQCFLFRYGAHWDHPLLSHFLLFYRKRPDYATFSLDIFF